MPTLHLDNVPDEVMETITRFAAARNRPVAAEAIDLLTEGVRGREPPARTGAPVPPAALRDPMVAPYIVPDVWPEVPGPRTTFVPADGGPARYEPCCESEEEAPE